MPFDYAQGTRKYRKDTNGQIPRAGVAPAAPFAFSLCAERELDNPKNITLYI